MRQNQPHSNPGHATITKSPAYEAAMRDIQNDGVQQVFTANSGFYLKESIIVPTPNLTYLQGTSSLMLPSEMNPHEDFIRGKFEH